MAIKLNQIQIENSIENVHIATNAAIAQSKISGLVTALAGKALVTRQINGHDLSADITLDSDDIGEGASNLYFTQTRARGALAAGGDLSYVASTGTFSVTTYKSSDFNTDFAAKSTDGLSEGTSNLYFTNVRARAALTVATVTGPDVQLLSKDTNGVMSVPLSGVFNQMSAGAGLTFDGGEYSFTGDTDDVTEGTGNLYFTQARARNAVSAGTGVSYDTATGQFSIGQAVGTTDSVVFDGVQVNGTLNSDDITSTNVTVSGNATITGNLTVQGTTTTVDSTRVELGDNIIELNSGLGASTAPSVNAGFEINRGSSANLQLYWDESNDFWKMQIEDPDGAVQDMRIAAIEQFQNQNGFVMDNSTMEFQVALKQNGGLIFDNRQIKVVGSQTVFVRTDGAIDLNIQTSDFIKDGTTGALGINANAIVTSKIADNAVTTNKIGASQVTAAKLAADSVVTSKIQDSAVSNVKLADSAITEAKIKIDKEVVEIATAPASGNYQTVFANIAWADGAQTSALTQVFLNGVKLLINPTAGSTLGNYDCAMQNDGSGDLKVWVDGDLLSSNDILEVIFMR